MSDSNPPSEIVDETEEDDEDDDAYEYSRPSTAGYSQATLDKAAACKMTFEQFYENLFRSLKERSER